MKIIIDLQICQVHGDQHPLSRFTLTLAQALLRQAPQHDIQLLLNGLLPQHIDSLRQRFAEMLPAEHIHVFSAVGPIDQQNPDNHWRSRAAQYLRENYLANLNADIVLHSQAFQGYHDQALVSGGLLNHSHANIIILGDLPAAAVDAETGRTDPYYAHWHQHCRQILSTADGLLALTPQAAEYAQQQLNIAEQRIIIIDPALTATADTLTFQPIIEALEQNAQQRPLPPVASVTVRPRLAYVSPLPPQQTGIADYSAVLLPELARYYDIDLITDQADSQNSFAGVRFPVYNAEWFNNHAGNYQRIVYHFGNSNFHRYMFPLLAAHPGIVVLHDYYLSGVLSNSERDGDQPAAFKKVLYQAHGYPALLSLQRDGLEAAVWQYPCNKAVLEQATGIIVHSQFAVQLARQHDGDQAAQDWITLPLLRAQPVVIDRDQARQQLAIHPEAFIICSFGLMGTTKLNQRLLQAWLDSPLIHDHRCHLIFVGGEDPSAYGQLIAETIAASGCQTRIAITGYVSPEQYQTYLAAADLAVQLRSQSRGETSASILDCLTYGLPTLINNNGAAAELPEHALYKLPDDFTNDQLSAALYELRTQPQRCQQLSQNAISYARSAHHPAHIVERYHNAIEQLNSHSARTHYQQLIQALSSLYRAQPPADQDALALAQSIAENQAVMPPKIFWVDISALVQIDLKTGIQRVVRSVLQQLLLAPPAGYRLEPIYDDAGCYRYARRYMLELLGESALDLVDEAAQFSPGDLFLGLDLYLDGIRRNHDLLVRLRHRGIQIYFVVYDLLPVLRPEVFPADTERHFHAWLDTIASVAHGLVCISQAVADELKAWLSPQPHNADLQTAATDSPSLPLDIGYFHLGADILASAPSYGISAEQQRIMQQLHGQTNLLMVGTVEPRKGHTQALAACEILWQQNQPVNLIIVGNQGWMVDELVQRLKNHPEKGRHLFWFKGISDELLMALYQTASALLAASEGEGFGLPLIEAAQHQLPIIARDLPVFKEVAGSHAYYFSGTSPQALAEALLDWQALNAAGLAPASTQMPWLTWEQSSQQLLEVLMRQHPCQQISRPVPHLEKAE